MSKIALEGNVSGSGTLTIAAPNTNSNFTLSLPTNTGTIVTQNSTPAFASTIGVGGATAAASGAGITFPATVSASSDANTLDDYEEGDWTPVLSGGTTTTYTTQTGSYTKIGRFVFVRGLLVINSVGNGSKFIIAGLPFTVATIAPGGTFTVGYFQDVAVNTTSIAGYARGAETAADFYSTASAAGTMGNLDVFKNTTRIDFAGCYQAA
jgi:hypothetical protein